VPPPTFRTPLRLLRKRRLPSLKQQMRLQRLRVPLHPVRHHLQLQPAQRLLLPVPLLHQQIQPRPLQTLQPRPPFLLRKRPQQLRQLEVPAQLLRLFQSPQLS